MTLTFVTVYDNYLYRKCIWEQIILISAHVISLPCLNTVPVVLDMTWNDAARNLATKTTSSEDPSCYTVADSPNLLFSEH